MFNASELAIRDFSNEMFMYLCILSGCDYLSNPPNKGMKRLVPFVKRGKTPDGILQCLQNEGSCEITEESCCLGGVRSRYRSDFRKAINSFHYQVVVRSLHADADNAVSRAGGLRSVAAHVSGSDRRGP